VDFILTSAVASCASWEKKKREWEDWGEEEDAWAANDFDFQWRTCLTLKVKSTDLTSSHRYIATDLFELSLSIPLALALSFSLTDKSQQAA